MEVHMNVHHGTDEHHDGVHHATAKGQIQHHPRVFQAPEVEIEL